MKNNSAKIFVELFFYAYICKTIYSKFFIKQILMLL